MKFRAFAKWCADRAVDGCWGKTEAVICCDIMEKMLAVNFLIRESVWQTVNELLKIEELIVNPTNEKIKHRLEANE